MTVALVNFRIYIFQDGRDKVRIGLLLSDSPYDNRLREAVLLAVDDINVHVERLLPKPPSIEIAPEDDQSVQIFIQGHGGARPVCNRQCLVVSPFGGQVDVNTGLNNTSVAQAYLELFQSSKSKVVTVIPVFQDKDLAFYEALVALAKGTRVKFTTPVVYKPSLYPRTDAMQIISDIGSRTAVRDNEDLNVFLISPQDLEHIIMNIKMYQRLQRLRWFVKDAMVHEDMLHTDPLATKFATRVSLTSLSFLGISDQGTFERLRNRLALRQRISAKFGSYFDQVQIYETVMRVHKAYTESLVGWGSFETILSEIYNSKSKSMVALMFKPFDSSLDILPSIGWLSLGIVNNTRYQKLFTHPLERLEVEKIAKESCKSDQVDVKIQMHPSPVNPDSVKCYNLTTFPTSAVSIPASNGVTVTMDCSDNYIRFEYACVPTKYDVGKLTCAFRSKRKRKPRAISDEFRKTSNILIDMIPNFLACGASVAGCDFCFYFLSTYNLTASPAACVGGCSLGTFGSCSSLVGTSLVKTFF